MASSTSTMTKPPIPKPFRESSKGNIYCPYNDLVDYYPDIPEKLKKEDKAFVKFDEFWVARVAAMKDQETGITKFLVFLDTKEKFEADKTRFAGGKSTFKAKPRINEIQMLPVQEANSKLKADRELELLSIHPTDGHWFAALVKRERTSSSTSTESDQKLREEIEILKERNRELEEIEKKRIEQSDFKSANQITSNTKQESEFTV